MLRRIVLVALAAVALAHGVAARAELKLSAEDRAWLAAHPVVRVVGDRNWAPIDFVDDAGNHAGIAADLLQRIGPDLGVRFEYLPSASWDEAYARAVNGEADLVSAIGRSPE